MSFVYKSQGFTIYPHRQAIEKDGQATQIRSKTFALLLLLLESPKEILSKKVLLDTIWDDVAVEEQVLVQSVRELRQLFGDAEIIQTFPRKGYSWAADVEKQILPFQDPATPLNSLLASDNDTQLNEKPRNKFPFSVRFSGLNKYSAALVLTVLLVVSATIFFQAITYHRASPSQNDVVIVLPVKTQMAGNDHDWVSLGGMDQLIRLLQPNKLGADNNVQVMSSEYVLQLMGYAQLPRNYDTQQVAKIFDISGATLLVESQLSGNVENYQLDYKLRYRNDIKRGVLFDRDLTQLMRQFALLISNQTGKHLQNVDGNVQAAFNNELMARALEKMNQQEFEPARDLLVGLKQLEPTNFVAREKLIESLMRLNKLDEAKSEIDQSIGLARASNVPPSVKMYFLLSIIHLQQGAFDTALQTLDQADVIARSNHDLLYLAGIANIRGDVLQARGSYELAQASFEQSMNYDKALRCPIGTSVNHIKLAKVFLLQGKHEQAANHYAEAKALIEKHQFDDLKAELETAKPAESVSNPI